MTSWFAPGDDEEEDEAQRRQRYHGAVFEGAEGLPVERALHRTRSLADAQHQGNRQQGEPRQQPEDRQPGHVLGDQSHCRGCHYDAQRTPTDHEALDRALFCHGCRVERQPIGAGIVERHPHLEDKGQGYEAPVGGARIDEGYGDEAEHLDGQAQQDVGFAVSHPEQVDAVAQHSQEDLDDEGDQGDGGEDPQIGHRQAAGEEVEPVEGCEVAEDGALGEVEQAEHRVAESTARGA